MIREAAFRSASGIRVRFSGRNAQYLSHNDNKLVNRPARHSRGSQTGRSISYIKSLVTTHQYESAPGPEMQVGFGENGGGLNMGGKKKVHIERRTNAAVLTLVKQVIPGDYGYDEQAWLRYIAKQAANSAETCDATREEKRNRWGETEPFLEHSCLCIPELQSQSLLKVNRSSRFSGREIASRTKASSTSPMSSAFPISLGRIRQASVRNLLSFIMTGSISSASASGKSQEAYTEATTESVAQVGPCS